MTDNEEKLLDLYAKRAAVYQIQYEVMGKLIDKDKVKNVIRNLDWRDIYIYGGAYLGIFSWMVFKEYVNIKGIVDKRESSYIPLVDVQVISIDTLKERYMDEPIIITPLEYGYSIREELLTFADLSKIYFVNELF